MKDLKPCPFCGAILEYEEHVAIRVPGKPIMRLWAHPAGECILSGMEVPKEDHEAWNRRAGMKVESLRPGDHVNAQMGTMPATDRQLYEAALQKMPVVTIPAAMDPRKGGGQA